MSSIAWVVTVPDGLQRIHTAFAQRLHDEGKAQQTLVEMSFKARDILAQRAHKNGEHWSHKNCAGQSCPLPQGRGKLSLTCHWHLARVP